MAKDKKDRLSEYQPTVKVMIEETPLIGMIREFSTGSIGYNFNGKVLVDGKKCQVTGNVVIVGTKPEKK